MSAGYRFAYGQARLQAHIAELPCDEDWQRLDAARGLSAFLEEARSGPLRPWVQGFSGVSDVHALERGLRSIFRETVAQLAAWVPSPWRPALEWAAWLPDLALLDHLGRGGVAPRWAGADPHWRQLLDRHGAVDERALAGVGADRLLVADGGSARVWLAEWRRRWPRCSRQMRGNLVALADLIGRHHLRLAATAPHEVWGLRRSLRARLRLLFHQRPLQPVGPFIVLGLIALDLERLRAALIGRALFVLDEAA